MKRAKIILDILKPPFSYDFVDIHADGTYDIVDVKTLHVNLKEWLRIILSSARASSPTFAAVYDRAWALRYSRNKDDPMFPNETHV